MAFKFNWKSSWYRKQPNGGLDTGASTTKGENYQFQGCKFCTTKFIFCALISFSFSPCLVFGKFEGKCEENYHTMLMRWCLFIFSTTVSSHEELRNNYFFLSWHNILYLISYVQDPISVEKEVSISKSILACPICYQPFTWNGNLGLSM